MLADLLVQLFVPVVGLLLPFWMHRRRKRRKVIACLRLRADAPTTELRATVSDGCTLEAPAPDPLVELEASIDEVELRAVADGPAFELDAAGPDLVTELRTTARTC